MKNKRALTLVLSLICFTVFGQSRQDSLINTLNTESLTGKVHTSYTSGNKDVAIDLQKTITEAVNFYERIQSQKFQIKLAVLDSVQWPHSWVPYGFVFYSGGWIFMNTGMSYENFKKVYGLEDIYNQLDSELNKEKVADVKLIESFYKVYAIHELGHYFISRLSNAKSPDKWTNEFIATYFSYAFFKNYDQQALKEFELFHRIHKDFYQPRYSSIENFNKIYSGMGVKNYVWYHSNFYFLVESLYDCYGDEFIPFYEELFPKNSEKKYTTTEIIQLLDKNCNDTVKNWVSNLEKVTKD